MNKSIDESKLIDLLGKIKNLKPKFKQICIGIDGFGGSGKSSLASNLNRLVEDIQVIAIDDFYKTYSQRNPQNKNESNINPDYDWERLKNQVFIPLEKGEIISYQKYNWHLDKLTDWVEIDENHLIIVEGVYCLQHDFYNYFDYKIWIETPRDIRLKRAEERDGTEKLDLWLNYWMLLENNYFEKEQPDLKADLVLNSF